MPLPTLMAMHERLGVPQAGRCIVCGGRTLKTNLEGTCLYRFDGGGFGVAHSRCVDSIVGWKDCPALESEYTPADIERRKTAPLAYLAEPRFYVYVDHGHWLRRIMQGRPYRKVKYKPMSFN